MPSSISDLLAAFDQVDLVITPDCPYDWNNGAHDIPITVANVPIIGMAYAHEGSKIPVYTRKAYLKLKETAAKEDATDAEIQEAVTAEVMIKVHIDYHKYVQWYLVLVACHQVRALTSGNLRQYAAMTGSKPLPANVLKYIGYWASERASLAGNASIRDRFIGNKFFEYHTSGSSTPNLCKRAVEESAGLDFFTEDEINGIVYACENEHDLEVARALPQMLLVKTRAVLEAAGTLPEVWYMGSRAKDEFSGQKYSAVVKIVKAIFRKQTNTENLEDKDVPSLARSARELLNSIDGQSGTILVKEPRDRVHTDLPGCESTYVKREKVRYEGDPGTSDKDDDDDDDDDNQEDDDDDNSGAESQDNDDAGMDIEVGTGEAGELDAGGDTVRDPNITEYV